MFPKSLLLYRFDHEVFEILFLESFYTNPGRVFFRPNLVNVFLLYSLVALSLKLLLMPGFQFLNHSKEPDTYTLNSNHCRVVYHHYNIAPFHHMMLQPGWLLKDAVAIRLLR